MCGLCVATHKLSTNWGSARGWGCARKSTRNGRRADRLTPKRSGYHPAAGDLSNVRGSPIVCALYVRGGIGAYGPYSPKRRKPGPPDVLHFTHSVGGMAYSKAAKDRRRCAHRFPDEHKRAGQRCRAWAMWGHPDQLCVAHGTDGRGPDGPPGERWKPRHTVPLCGCRAYKFPHRPGGGLCRWPDPPLREHPTPAGTSTGWGFPSFPWTDSYPRRVIPSDVVQAEGKRAPKGSRKG